MKKRIKKANGDLFLELIKISKKAKELRLKKGYSSVEPFIRKYGLSRSVYIRFENGKDINFSSLVKIMKALNTPFAEFFSEKNKKN